MSELKSKCCGANVRKARFSSLIEKEYCEPFYICNVCNKLTKVEEKGRGQMRLKEEELLSVLTAVFSYYLSKCNYKETATKYEEAHKQIRALIQKPEITEEFLSDKGKLFVYAVMPSNIEPTRSDIHAAKEFLRSLFKEMKDSGRN